MIVGSTASFGVDEHHIAAGSNKQLLQLTQFN